MQTVKRILELIVAAIVGGVIAVSAHFIHLDRSGALRADTALCKDSEKLTGEAQ